MAESASPLADLRVLASTADLPGHFAALLLAALGADVVRLPSRTTTMRETQRRSLERGGRRVLCDDASTWASLAAAADAVLIDEGGLPQAIPSSVITCRVSTWGQDDATPTTDEALVHAVTAMQASQRSWSGAPVWLVTPMAGYMTGILAALGLTAAHFARLRGAPAQTVHTSMVHGAIACNAGTYVSGPGSLGRLTGHGTPRGPYPSYGLYRTADGWLLVAALTPAFFVNVLTVAGRLDLFADPELAENPMAFSMRDYAVVRDALEPIFITQSTATWVDRLRAADVPCAVVQSRSDVLADAEARALDLVVPIEDSSGQGRWEAAGPPAVFSDTPARPLDAPPVIERRPETLAARWHASGTRHRATSSGPRTCLAGIRVLDLTSFIAGPVCPVLLADLGADVVKIESAGGDPFRLAAFGFVGWNRGKRSLVLDLKHADGRAAFLDLAAQADVVVDNFRPGVMARLAIDTPTLHAMNPRLIHTAITGYGTHAALPGFDPVFQARAGLMDAQGGTDEPVFHTIAYNDYTAGTLAALATVAALVARERTGRGQRVDVSLFRTAILAQAGEMHEGLRGGRDLPGPLAARRLYRVRDGWVCLSATTPAAAAGLAACAGVPFPLDAPADGEAADALAAIVRAWTRVEATARLATHGVPATGVVTFDEVFTDARVHAARALVTVDDPNLGRITQCGPVLHFSATPIPDPRPAPGLGADGPRVLAEAGFDAERIAQLMATGVVQCPPPA